MTLFLKPVAVLLIAPALDLVRSTAAQLAQVLLIHSYIPVNFIARDACQVILHSATPVQYTDLFRLLKYILSLTLIFVLIKPHEKF